MNFLINNDYFGISLSLAAFIIGIHINKRTNKALYNPLLISTILIIIVLQIFNIEYDVYRQRWFWQFLYIKILKNNIIAILIGIFSGTIISITSVLTLGIILKAEKSVLLSLAPKAVTASIAIEVSKVIGSIPTLTTVIVVITGIFGACFGPEILRLFNVRNNIGIGTTTHVIGTTRAIKEGEIAGAMSSVAIAIAGIVTAFATPFITNLVKVYFI